MIFCTFFKSVFVWHSGLLVYNVIFTVRPNRPDTLCWRCCDRMTNVFLSCDKNLHCCIIILSFTLNMKFRNWKWPVSASGGTWVHWNPRERVSAGCACQMEYTNRLISSMVHDLFYRNIHHFIRQILFPELAPVLHKYDKMVRVGHSFKTYYLPFLDLSLLFLFARLFWNNQSNLS